MSKDMLGSVTRALVNVPQRSLGLILDIANRIQKKDAVSEGFYQDLAKFVRNWFPVWKSISIRAGLHTRDEVRKAIDDAGMKLSMSAFQFLGWVTSDYALKHEGIRLVKVSGRELGFRMAVPLEKIYERAAYLGLSSCPIEVVPQLRLEYGDQPRGEGAVIASDLLYQGELFLLNHTVDGMWLTTDKVASPLLCLPDVIWIFKASNN